ncbi:hypothetical protein CsSME_00003159 [Camellia sinensis var. sinensis]|uniref:Uncharacterized protein n=1 Tax=Camellia sinensis var. sinensis TaxID=542762 RepID=A0A4S4DPN1_CAMSN|nr:uncharacterized protein LOC114308262 [Camellia sinensis]THG04166.1 hypothetical protein TEA_015507 [Camellia sinensis var. sinensis]
MEANLCDLNHLDSDVLLPPRKRLLAGLKKQNFDANSHHPSASSSLSGFDSRLNNLMRSHLKNPNLSPEEIVEASRSAAAAAVRVAEAARAVAEEKAEIAAKAVAAAKSALQLVETVSEEATSKERYLKKNKMKKHLPVQMLYNKHKRAENCKTDEELARKLHQAMNSSPRISKNSSTSELKSNKYKRLKKGLPTSEKTRVSNGGIAWEGIPSNGNGVTCEVGSEGSVHEGYPVGADENTLRLVRADRLKMDNGGAETSHTKEKMVESSDETCSISRKRGRMKQKKLPLSICTFRDRANPKEGLKYESSPSTEENKGKSTSSNKPLFSVRPPRDGMMPVETTSMWKCQAFKAPVCVKQNKVMQS